MSGRGVIIFFILCIFSKNSSYGLPWLLGCLHGNFPSDDLPAPKSNSSVSVAACLEACLLTRYDIAVYQRQNVGGSCFHTDGTGLGHLLSQLDIDSDQWFFLQEGETPGDGCYGDESDIDTFSADIPLALVYLCQGPEIENITLSSPSTLYAGVVVTIQATAEISIWEPPQGINVSYLRLWARWQKDDVLAYSEVAPVSWMQSEANGEAISIWLHLFLDPGLFHVGVNFSTGASHVAHTTRLAILPPVPSGLLLTLHPGATVVTPTCIPAHLADSPEPALIIFSRQRSVLQASLSSGVGVSFDWQFGDRNVSVRDSGGADRHCLGLDCRRSIVEHVFDTEGIYSVKVKVSSPYGSLEETFHVVAVDWKLEDLTLSVKENFLAHVSTPIHFLVTVTTTNRATAWLKLELGDGSFLHHPLKEVSPTEQGIIHRDLLMAGNYGSGCRLSVDLRHTYEVEGSFLISATITDETSSVFTTLPLHVYRMLEGPLVRGVSAIATGELTNFTLSLQYDSEFRQAVTWTVFRDENKLLLEENTPGTTWQHTFWQIGRYTIQASVENPVSCVSTTHTMVVQSQVKGLTISTLLPAPIVKARQNVTLQAYYSEGTDVTCSWTFSCHCTSCLQSWNPSNCHVSYTFPSSLERCFISVTAHNLVGEQRASLPHPIVIQEEVAGVYASITTPVLLGDTITVSVSVAQGSSVQVYVTIQDSFMISATYDRSQKVYVARMLATEHGNIFVMIRACNNISSVELLRSTRVVPRLGRIAVMPQGCRLVNKPVLLVATIDSHVPGVPDQFLYTWKIGNSSTKYTSIPVFEFTPSTPTDIIVSLSVSNEVDVQKTECLVQVQSSISDLCLQHAATAMVGKKVTFTLMPGKKNEVILPYWLIEGDPIYWANMDAFHSDDEEYYNWSHMFMHPGLVYISIPYTNPATKMNFTLHSICSVQSQLENITITGPGIVPIITGLPVLYSWEAHPSISGTLYEWVIGEKKTITFSNKFYPIIPLPGRYVILLKAWNSFNSIEVDHHVDAFMIIQLIETVVANLSTEEDTSFYVTVQGGGNIDLFISFGDGQSHKIYYQNSTLFAGAPTIEFQVKHRYSVPGRFYVWINASNDISWLSHSITVVVQEPISGIKLTLLSSSLVALLEEVIVEATVESGSDLTYTWDFGDKSGELYTVVKSDGNTSTAYHSYGIANTYWVTVEVINSLMTEPIVASLDIPIQAVEQIVQLDLKPVTDHYAAPLIEGAFTSNGTVSTKLVTFEARVWRGSDVQFIFDFGDGHQEEIPAVVDVWSATTGVASHAYKTEGAFLVSVTAKNPLGSVHQALSQPFIVQFPPQDLKLNEPHYIALQGSVIYLYASLSKGTNISFDWIVGDDIHLFNAGSSVPLSFMKADVYNVTVEAYNNVTDLAYDDVMRPRASAKIYVQEPLQGIELCVETVDERRVCEGGELELPTEKVIFEAKVLPETKIALRFIWELGTGELRRTNSHRLNHIYRDPGKYVVNVTAQNHVSSSSSGAIKLHFVEKVGNLTSIRHHGSILIGNPVTFHALYWFGTNLTFEWKFGDGKLPVQTPFPTVQHNYTEIGEYWVKVVAWNKFSRAETSTNIFVLDQPCQKPEIKFIEQSRKIRYFEDIQIEADVSTSCSITSDVNYDWSLSRNGRILKTNITSDTWHQRELLIPRGLLPEGEYIVELKVEMNDTIVYSAEKTAVIVEVPPLIVSVKGGILRKIGRHEDVILEAYILNNEIFEDQNFSFSWVCSGLNEENLPCFTNNFPNLSHQSFTIISGSLNSNLKVIIFNVTVMQGMQKATASQVLEIVDGDNPLLIKIMCITCQQNQVNVDSRIVFEATCDNCAHLQLDYTWHLWIIQDGNHNLQIGEYDCVQADGSTFYIISANLTTPATSNTLANAWDLPKFKSSIEITTNVKTSEDELPPFPSLPGFPDEDTQKYIISEAHGKKRVLRADWKAEKKKHLPILLPPVEGEAEYENFTYPSEFIAFQDFPTGLHPPYYLNELDFPVTEEGLPGEGGSAAARDQSLQNFGNNLIGSAEEQNGIMEGRGMGRGGAESGHSGVLPQPFPVNPHKGDPVKNDRSTVRTPAHVVQHIRNSVPLHSYDSTTGIKSHHLAIKPGVLRTGSSYLVEVIATAKGNSSILSGSAMDHIIASLGPMNGRCTLMPTTGLEFETQFRLHCLEWQSEKPPLFYELRYSLSTDGPCHLIYFGQNSNIKFVLPSGIPAYNYSVYLDVIVRDSHGAGTKVCSIVREVQPNELIIGTNFSHYLFNTTFHPKSFLNKLLGEKHIQGILQFIHALMTSINQQTTDHMINSDELSNFHAEVRHHCLQIIKGLIFFSKAEAVQVLSALSVVIQAPNNLSDVDLRVSLSIMQNIFSKFNNLGGHFPRSQVVYMFLIALSRFNDASVLKIVESKTKDSNLITDIEQSKYLLFQVLKVTLKNLVQHEEPHLLKTQHLSALTGYITSRSHFPYQIDMGQTKIILYSSILSNIANLEAYNNSSLRCPRIANTNQQNCCIAVLAESSSYNQLRSILLSSNSLSKIKPSSYHTASLTFLTCKSFKPLEDIATSLIQDVEVHLIRSKERTKDKLRYTLHKRDMHVHLFNISNNHLNWSLQIVAKVFDVDKGKQGFPLQILLSKLEPPRIDNYVMKKSFDEKSKTLEIFIPQNIIKEAEVYFLGIVDADYSEGYPHKNFANSQNYSLFIWWQQCLQWNKKTWTPDACIVMNSSGQDNIHCRCSQLSGVDFLSYDVPTELLIFPAQHLLSTPLCLTSIIVILALLIIYLILFIPAYNTDTKITLKPTLMLLKDNNFELGYKYLVSIETGCYHRSGTTAVVCFVLYGENGMSKMTQLIGKDAKNVFCQQSSTDTFLLNTSCCLGPLLKVHLWHNNAGSDPSWFLKDIMITDLQQGSHYYFACERWFSVEGEDGLIERELLVSEYTWNFWKILNQRFIYNLHDIHLWASVYCRPPHSLFTHVQRLTCCLSLILTSSSLIAVWYSYQFTEYKNGSNHLDFTFPSLCVGAAVSLVVMVPHTLLGVMFRFCQSPQPLWMTIQNLFWHWYTWGTSYCWMKHKYSNPTESVDGSSTPESTESMYQSYPHSLDYQSGSFEVSEEEKANDDEVISLASFLRGSLSPLAETLSNWHAFENWARQKHQVFCTSLEDLGDCDSLTEGQIRRNDHKSSQQVLFTSEIVHMKHSRQNTQISGEIAHAHAMHEDCNLHELSSEDYNEISSQLSSSGFEDCLDSEVMNRVIKSVQSDSSNNFNEDISSIIARSLGVLLPSWIYCCGYIILVISICTSVCVTLILSNSFGLLQATYWLYSLFVSILCSIFLLHPLLVFIIAVISALRSYLWSLNPNEQHTYIVNLLHSACSEKYQKNKCNIDAGWQRKESSHFYQYLRPPPEPLLIEARRQMLTIRQILTVLREMITSSITCVLLIFMICGKDVAIHLYQSKSVHNAFVKLPSSSLLQITSHSDWWCWLHNDFLNAFYGTQEFTMSNIPVKYCQILEATGSFPIGEPSVRQFRLSSQLCSEPLLPFSSLSCEPKYSRMNKMRKYNSKSHSNIRIANYSIPLKRPMKGQLGFYKAEDIHLTESKNESGEILKRMEGMNWLDNQSRAVVVDFLLFNPTFTLFTSVSLLVEFPAAGGAIATPFILSCRLYPYITRWDFIVMICEWAFISMNLWQVKGNFWEIMKLGKHFWRSSWNWAQVIICILSICYGICYFHRFSLMNIAVQNFLEYHQYQQVDITRVAEWDQVLQALLGLLLFFHMISWLHFLQINKRMRKFLQIIVTVWKEIFTLQILLLFLILGYSIIGNLMFESKGRKYTSPLVQCLRLLRSLLRRFQNAEHLEASFVDFYMFIFMASMLVAFFLIIALMRALLNKSKKSIKIQKNNSMTFMNLVHFIQETLIQPFLNKKQKASDRKCSNDPPATEFLLLELETLVEQLMAKADKLFSDLNLSLSNLSLTSDCREYNDENEQQDGCPIIKDELLEKDEDKACVPLPSVGTRYPFHMPLHGQLTNSSDGSCEPWSTTSNDSLSHVNHNYVINMPLNYISCASLSTIRKTQPTMVHHLSDKSSPVSTKSSHIHRSNSSWNSVTLSQRQYRVRKTFPIHLVETSSSEIHDQPIDLNNGGLSLRKTKSRGKGKNHDFNFKTGPSKS